jgi:hypothetical protein
LKLLRSAQLAGLNRLGASACSSAVGNALAFWCAATPLGHVQMVALGGEDRVPIVMCQLCGLYTEANVVPKRSVQPSHPRRRARVPG